MTPREPRIEAHRPNADIRKWYHLARWKHPIHGLRAIVLREEPLCRPCLTYGQVTASTDADHIVRHEGRPALFWARANLQGLCHACHARKTMAGA